MKNKDSRVLLFLSLVWLTGFIIANYNDFHRHYYNWPKLSADIFRFGSIMVVILFCRGSMNRKRTV